MKPRYKVTDGGKAKSGMLESKDCTVRALSNVTGMGYPEAHAVCREHGRRFRHGMYQEQQVAAFETLKRLGRFEFTRVAEFKRHEGPTVARLLPTLPKQGRFYICTTNHAFAYVDGYVLETSAYAAGRTRMRVEDVFQCEVLRPPVAPSQVVAADITQDQINELWARLDRLEGK